MVKYLVFFLAACLCSTVMAQSKLIVTGTVIDSKDKTALERTSIVLLNAKDSILVNFARANPDGKFTLSNVDTGHYQLIVNYPQYADVVKDIKITDQPVDLGKIELSKAAILLEEAQVTGKIPVVIKGDTVEYDAASFKVEEGAKVEGLLRVLPGVTVNPDGSITAQGKTVKKVLLDGEEFFGDDPTLITKNIRADMVSKVQVYEKKSELADRTGIDDGVRDQTIDIKLKEDSKKGAFGELSAGLSPDKYYSATGVVNRFKGAQKIAVFGTAGNEGTVGLGFFSNQKFGVGSSSMETMDGGIFITNNDDDSFSGRFEGNGVPKSINTGASYSDKTANSKHKINANYKYSRLQVDNNNRTFMQNELPGFSRIENNESTTNNLTQGHNTNVKYDLQLDSSSTMTFTLGYKNSNRENRSSSNGLEQSLEYDPINKSIGRSFEEAKSDNVDFSTYYTKKFAKPKRSLTFKISANSSDQDSRNQYFSSVEYLKKDSIDIVDQYKHNLSDNKGWSASVNYSEPITKRLTATVGYEYNDNRSKSLNQSFDRDPITQEYTNLDEDVLNDIRYKYNRNTGNLGFNYVSDKTTINLTNRVTASRNFRNDYVDQRILDIDQLSYNPNLNINYKLSKSKTIRLNYYGNTIQPNLNQILPLRQNTDQKTTFLPNEDLEAGFRNTVSVSYNSFKQLKQQYFYVSIYLGNTSDNITSFVTIDPTTGMRTLQYVNVFDKKNLNGSIYGSFDFNLKKKYSLKSSVGLSLDYNAGYNYITATTSSPELNLGKSVNYSANIGFNRHVERGFTFYTNLRPGVSFMSSSVQPQNNSKAFTFRSFSNVSYLFSKEYKVAIDMDQDYQAATSVFNKAINNYYVNAYVSKKFFKDKSLETRLSVNDLFNQRNGIRRSQSGSTYTETQNDVINRYFMFKVIYNFTTMKGGSQK